MLPIEKSATQDNPNFSISTHTHETTQCWSPLSEGDGRGKTETDLFFCIMWLLSDWHLHSEAWQLKLFTIAPSNATNPP